MRSKAFALGIMLSALALPALALPPIPPYTISGGVDLSTNLGHPLKTDAQGQLYVVGGGVGGSVYGTGTLGVAPSQAPVLVGGVNAGGAGGLTQLYTDANGRVVLAGETNGAALSGLGQRMMGSDGTFARDILTDTGGNVYVRGSAINGSTSQTNNMVPIAGYDGTNNRYILTDTSGRQIVSGAAANGASVAGNPFWIAGYDGTTLRALSVASGQSDGASGNSQLQVAPIIFNGTNYDRLRTANGAANTTGTGLAGAGQLIFDGTNWQKQASDSSGNEYVRTDSKSANTYSSSIGGLALTANGTIFQIQGSASKIIHLKKLVLTAKTTSADVMNVGVLKASTAMTGGTPIALTAYKMQSAEPTSTATVSENSGGNNGTITGSYGAYYMAPILTTSGQGSAPYEYKHNDGEQDITLSGTGEYLQLFFSATTPSNIAVDIYAEWTEE